MGATRVLIAVRDRSTRQLAETVIRRAGYVAQSAANATAALAHLASESFAALVTDAPGLESVSGQLLAQARAFDPFLELIVLADEPSLASAIAALELGVRGYLRLPLSAAQLEEQLALATTRRRIHEERSGTLRLPNAAAKHLAEPERPTYIVASAAETPLCVGDITIEIGRRRVLVDGVPKHLSSGEFDLLLLAARHRDSVLRPEYLVRELLRFPCDPYEARDLIKARVHRLRKKIELDPAHPQRLVSVRGAGYMLCSKAE